MLKKNSILLAGSAARKLGSKILRNSLRKRDQRKNATQLTPIIACSLKHQYILVRNIDIFLSGQGALGADSPAFLLPNLRAAVPVSRIPPIMFSYLSLPSLHGF